MRLTTLVFLYIALSVAWLTLADSIQKRHDSIDRQLRADVAQLWGSHHRQSSPGLAEGGEIDRATVDVDLDLQYRKKGHYWYSTYTAHFRGEFHLEPNLRKAATFVFPLPTGGGMLSDFQVELDGRLTEDYEYSNKEQTIQVRLPETGTKVVTITYAGQGADRWWYSFEQRQPRHLRVNLKTNFDNFDFPDGSVSPVSYEPSEDGGWNMTWNYDDLLTGAKIGLELPKKNNTGPALIDICRFGPLGLLLFFAAVGVCSIDAGKPAHPMTFMLLGCGFFSFHLLLVYLGDLIPIAAAFPIAAAIATLINWNYGNKVFDPHFSRTRLLPAQILYLVLFSSAFLVEGLKGLPLVCLLVLSLHLLMQITAKLNWDRFEGKEEAL